MKNRTRKLKVAVRNPKTGIIRRFKLPKKTPLGRIRDRKTKSSEFHEVRYRKDKRKGKR